MTGDAPATVVPYAKVAAAVMAAPPGLGPVRLIAVDGPAGSGKTTFAGRLAAALRATGATVGEIHTDDLLAGWTDLESYWPRLDSRVLAPLRRGEAGAYHPYDWVAGEFDARERPVPVTDVLVIEGVGSGRRAIGAELSLLAWVEVSDELRLARGVARDGESLREQWIRWMADEVRHFATERTRDRADLRIYGAAQASHDPCGAFVGDISGWTGLTR
jgi:uridine kinase